ncbi:MAG: SURF1 family protein [Pseudomonadota bacterium]
MTSARRLTFLLLVGLGGVAFLASLGVWQLQRLEWKQGIIAELESRLALEPLALTGSETAESANFRRAMATGRYVETRPATFLTSMKPTGPGHRLIYAFELSGGGRILVDRGYLPDGLEPPPPPIEEVSLTGALHWPNEISAFTPDPNIAERRWFARDVPSLASALETQPVMLVESARSDGGEWPKPLPVSVDLPNDHLGYAVTWFSVATIWLVMTVLLMRRRRDNAN